MSSKDRAKRRQLFDARCGDGIPELLSIMHTASGFTIGANDNGRLCIYVRDG